MSKEQMESGSDGENKLYRIAQFTLQNFKEAIGSKLTVYHPPA